MPQSSVWTGDKDFVQSSTGFGRYRWRVVRCLCLSCNSLMTLSPGFSAGGGLFGPAAPPERWRQWRIRRRNGHRWHRGRHTVGRFVSAGNKSPDRNGAPDIPAPGAAASAGRRAWLVRWRGRRTTGHRRCRWWRCSGCARRAVGWAGPARHLPPGHRPAAPARGARPGHQSFGVPQPVAVRGGSAPRPGQPAASALPRSPSRQTEMPTILTVPLLMPQLRLCRPV